jgi:hypothetical protein
LAGLVLAVVLSAPAAARPAAHPELRNLVRTWGGIRAFAQDGNTVAWAASQVDRYRVRAKNLSTRKTVVLGDAGGYRSTLDPPTLAVAGSRVLWTKSWFGTRLYVDVRTVTVAEESGRKYVRPAWLAETSQGDECGEDGYFAGAAGDGATLVWAWTVVSLREPGACGENGFDREVVGGGVVPGTPPFPPPPQQPGMPSPITGVPAPAPMYSNGGERRQAKQVAVSQGRIAVLPSPTTIPGRYYYAFPTVIEGGPVEVHTRAGRLVFRVFPAGTVRELAFSWPHLAMLVQRHDGSRAIERYGPDGALESAVPVAGTATDVSIGTGGTVYRVGRVIYTIRGTRPVPLWRAKATPIGLSVEGRRVAWAVNLNGSGLIVALTLPR